MNYKTELIDNGVVLVKNAWVESDLAAVAKDYNNLDQSLTNKEIVKDKPIIVFWKHVVGEQKRICTFEEFGLIPAKEFLEPIISSAIMVEI